MIRVALFDLDDTLLDHTSAANRAVIEWAQEHGQTDSQEVTRRWTEICDVHYARYQRRELTMHQQRRERIRDFFADSMDDERADALFAGYLHRYEANWVPFDDAGAALRRARQAGVTVAVLTNGDAVQQRSKLERAGLLAEIDQLVASSDLSAGKPDPRAFEEALRVLAGVARHEIVPADAMMVGDSLVNDVRGALDAGLSAVLLDRHGHHPDAGVPRARSLAELTFT